MAGRHNTEVAHGHETSNDAYKVFCWMYNSLCDTVMDRIDKMKNILNSLGRKFLMAEQIFIITFCIFIFTTKLTMEVFRDIILGVSALYFGANIGAMLAQKKSNKIEGEQ
jgi:hypothetical protein